MNPQRNIGKCMGAIAMLCLVAVAIAGSAAAQQAQADGKTTLAADGKTTPLLSAPVNLAPQMIGDEGFGLVVNPIKITENESPRPMDRVFFTYNYFHDIGPSGSGDVNIDVHREVIGFEKTFLDGRGSVGLRLPFSTIDETFFGRSQTETNFGDLNLIGKFALINNRETGNVLSIGLSVTLPTETVDNPEFRDVRFQPFIGGIYNAGNFFLQGFSSVVVPTDSRDDAFFLNDLGAGYFLYRNQATAIRAIVPVLEVHLTTPLDNNNGDNSTWVNLVPGVHIQVLDRTWLTFGAGVPVAGPKPFAVEAISQVNFRF